jgi:O-antigen/teichoic acid export membrane protein
MTLVATAARSIFWAAVGSGSLAVVSFMTIIILAHVLGPADFGLAALALSIVQIITLFVEQPFNDAIIQRNDLEPLHLDTAFWANLAVALVLIMGCFAAHNSIATLFGQPRLPYLIEWLTVGVVFSALSSIPIAQLRRQMRFRELSVRSVVSRIAGVVVAIGMAYNGYGVWSIIAQQIIAAVVGTVMVWSAGLRHPQIHFSMKHLDELVAIGIPVMVAKFVGYSSSRIYSIMIGYFLGTTALGYWNAGMRVVETISALLSDAAESVGLSVFARHQTDLDVMRQWFYSASQLATLVSIPVLMGMVVTADEFVRLILGVQWLPAAPLVQIVAFSNIAYFTFMFGEILLTALGRPRWLLGLRTCNLALNLIGLAVFHNLGLPAAAVVWSGVCLFTLPAILIIIRRLIAIDFLAFFQSVASPFSAGILMAGLLFFLKYEFLMGWPSELRLAVLIVVGALTYPAVIWILAPVLFQRFVRFANKAVFPA